MTMIASGPAGTITHPYLRVLLPFACGYVISYMLRTVNAVIAPDLVSGFGVGPDELGLLTSAYFFSFALFQLPLGILLDRYGPRRVNALLLLFAAAGCTAFAASDSLSTLVLGRALIGLGVSACLMAAIKAFALWFPLSRMPALNGWMLFSGGLGALIATAPVEAALHVAGWRGVFVAVAILAVAASALVFLVVPEPARREYRESLGDQLRGAVAVFGSRVFWQVALVAMLTQSTFMAIQGLWAGPWLKDVAGLARAEVAAWLLYMALATMAGSASFGTLATRLSHRGIPPIRVFKAGVAVFLLAQAAIVFGLAREIRSFWLLFGFTASAGSLSYAILSQRFPLALTGRVSTGVNFLVFVSAFLCQWGIGVIIKQWPVEAGRYHADGYQAGFGLFLALQAAAFAWLLLDRARERRATGIAARP